MFQQNWTKIQELELSWEGNWELGTPREWQWRRDSSAGLGYVVQLFSFRGVSSKSQASHAHKTLFTLKLVPPSEMILSYAPNISALNLSIKQILFASLITAFNTLCLILPPALFKMSEFITLTSEYSRHNFKFDPSVSSLCLPLSIIMLQVWLLSKAKKIDLITVPE